MKLEMVMIKTSNCKELRHSVIRRNSRNSHLINTHKKLNKYVTFTNYSITRNSQHANIINKNNDNYDYYGELRRPVIFLHRLRAELRGGLYIYTFGIYISPVCRMCPTVKEEKNGRIFNINKDLSGMRGLFAGV